MPQSAVSAGTVDKVLPPSRIAAELIRVGGHLAQALPESIEVPEVGGDAEAFGQILQLLCDTSGVDFLHYKHSTLRRRIERRLVLRQLDTLNDYLRCLRDEPAEARRSLKKS